MKQWAQKQNGFTIVELLIVIVVIAILAAITIVAYNGITSRTKDAAVQSDLASAYKKLETLKIQNPSQVYPLNQSATGLTGSSGTTLTYTVRNSGAGYCVDSVYGQLKYFITSASSAPTKGSCQNVALWLKGAGAEASGNGTALVLNEATASAGLNGGAAYAFNGSQRVIASSNASVNVTQGSVSMWVNRTSAGGLLFASGAPGATGLAAISSLTVRLVGGQIYGGWADGAASNPDTDQALSNAALNSGQWYHVVTSWTSSPSNVRVYIDGTAQTVQDVHSNNSKTGWVDQIVLGGNDATGSYSGLIDDVRVFSNALTDAEVGELYANGPQ